MENPPPVRAPYDENEGYMPLRKPKSAANTPTHSVGLSPDAMEFTPSNAASNFQQDRLEHQQRYQQQHNQQNYSHFQQNKPHHHQQQQQQHHVQHHNQHYQQQHHNQHHHQQHHQNQHQHQHQRYNGFQQMPQHQNPQQHQQQQYYSTYGTNSSVQGRLKVNKPGNGENSSGYSPSPSSSSKHAGGSSNNYNNYNQRQRNHHQQQHHNHHQSYQNSGSAAAAVHQTTAVEVETIALDYLQTVIQCLNQNPGQFDTIGTRFLTIFDGMENNDYVLSNAMEDIFQESIQKPNFRYMGAKLYNLLHMLNLKKDSLFHMLLKCKLDYHQNELVQYMKQPQQHQMVRETALFLAELYMQLRGDDSRIHLIAENIVFALKQLLSKESNDNVRCICLTLKLAGYDLTSDCPMDMQEIIQQLDAINCKNPGKYPLAVNVISLQKNNWGRKISSNSMCEDEEKLKQPEPLRTSDEPIFYGPDGRELTAEESDFLTSHVSGGADSGIAGAGGGSTDEEDGQDLDVDYDPEMDEETEKAYKEFCKLKPSS